MADLRLLNPFSMLVAGSSQTGKTFWVRTLLQQAAELYSRPPGPILFFYREWQPQFEEFDAEFRPGMPCMDDFQKLSGLNATVVMDDLMHQVSGETAELFTMGCSRYGVNIIFITQNLFDKNSYF